MIALSPAAQFRKHVFPTNTESCWNWNGALNHSGYGLIRDRTSEARYKGEPIRAHRLAYELYRGPIPKGMVLDHLCRNRACVNPYHLEPVTIGENKNRGIHSNQNTNKTHCKHGHEFSPSVPPQKACTRMVRGRVDA